MKKKAAFSVLFISVVGLIFLSFTGVGDRYFEIGKNLDIFSSVYKEVNNVYVDDVNPNKLMRTGIDAMLNSLDPYTNYISEDEVEDYKTIHTGEFGSIGAATHRFGNRTLVTMVYKGYAAFEKGVQIGDEIISVNDREIARLTAEEAEQLMSGQEGTLIRLKVKRVGSEIPVDLEFRLQAFKRHNVPYFGMIDSETGYLKLSEFTREAAKEVSEAVVKLKSTGAKNIILDLRGNPGGLLDESVNICGIFLNRGKKVVTMKGRVPESNNVYETRNSPIDSLMPLTVLINSGSASASEIVAGTLQDYDRAVIVGQKSFGKGLVQAPKLLSYNSQVKITIAKYYTPTGRCIQVLDYSHRNEDGSVGSVPDSVKREFITSHGRKVFDGGGIDPDQLVPPRETASIVRVLNSQGYIFDFATQYASKHTTIPPARQFALTDSEYQEFIQWMKNKPYVYKSALEIQWSALLEESKRERSYNDLKPQLDQIAARLDELRRNDLLVFRDQIRSQLEKEIASRYYLEAGMVETSFKNDSEVKESIDFFHNPARYKKTLNLR